ncbi:peptide chain release factor N(5)-glutamine methyltransferase [Apibacter raozihei]|uniref:peptide chain release factor N(5)-glutamine methyltransferase n=1 Tax=Apibacter raozihei TaxID=2500547 RepID=UPI000FE3C19A|nr:peptide chain release factor N(5)-glutamine methyltransferase [Apibacter raozihei]
MKTLGQLREQFYNQLSQKYNAKEIDIIFYSLAENYLHKSRSVLKLGLNEQRDDLDIQNILFQTALYRLMEDEPYQYILGNTEFYGCEILVNSDVLIPRPETEELVEWIVDRYKNKINLNIIDLCTGSGCIAIALAKSLQNFRVFGLDISEKALETANKNKDLNNVEVDFFSYDLLNSNQLSNNELFDIIVSNPPYIRNSEKVAMDKRVLNFEPAQALFVTDSEPLIFYQKIIDFAKNNLKDNGEVFIEINQELGRETKELFLDYFSFVELKQDISGNFRMIKAHGIQK